MKLPAILICILATLSSCERDIQLDFPPGDDVLVVEGYIENEMPPVVILSRGLPFFGEITPDEYQKFFVSGAKVMISVDNKTDTLTEFKFDGGILYSHPTLRGQEGKTYQLAIRVNEQTYTSSATILPAVPLDSIWTIPAPEGEVDKSLVQLMCRISDPPAPGNYYRGMTKRNRDLFFDTSFNSVYDDQIVNGKSFNFNLFRGKSGYQNSDTADFKDFGYFKKGDTIYVKWCSIEREQFDFWNTYESQGSSFGNPFSSTVIIKSNVQGKNVVGLWASYGAFIDTVIAE